MRIRSGHRGASSAGRGGFTLIEMMVVIAIILVLVAITAAGTAKVISAQRVSNTKAIIQKVDGEFQKQWKAAVDNAVSEANTYIPQSILNMSGVETSTSPPTYTNIDTTRAQVIWLKLRMHAEFPGTFAEAFGFNALPSQSGVNSSDLPVQPAYGRALANSGITGGSNPPGPNESGVCLLLALSVGRRGAALNSDLLGSLTLGNAAPGLKMIVDGFGTPIWFCRWPYLASFTTSSATQAIDPLDPTGRLMDPTWNTSSNPNIGYFETLCHPIHTVSGSTWVPISYNLIPTIASPGPDRSLGLDPYTMAQVDSTANDNIYNHQ